MQPPLLTGTILQNRYRLLSVLGQGGFGRTYLAEDQGRFQELCALKELILQTTQGFALDKVRELFQREAAILYQIQHPQIPQFRATFEQDLRLFLVQEYVQGKTYQTLLDERQSQGNVFLQAEALEFLRQLLPVLAYIHSNGIVHRDIAPDNIILRDRDRLPVLIDFGVVKELASRIQLPDPMKPVTTAGKLGYAPSEQLQSGRAYPSSDLYALAVTVIVLLTGKEPQELFDDIQLSWQWQRWVNVSDWFAGVLNRMLSYRPSDRFQSAGEVLQALNNGQASGEKEPVTIHYPPAIPSPKSPSSNPPSQLQTIAVVGHQTPVKPNPTNVNRLDRVIPQPNSRRVWENPAFIIALGTCVALLAGFGSWAAVRSFITSQQPQISPTPVFVATPTPTPIPSEAPTPLATPTSTPLATPTSTPLATPTSTASPETYSQRLDLPLGTTVSKDGNLKENATVNYIISAQQNQQLTATLNGQGVLMTVLGPDKNPVGDNANRVLDWKGPLPFSGEYTIELKPIRGLPQSNYKLAISLEKAVTPTPTPTETPTPTPTETLTPTPTPTISPTAPEFDIEQLDLPPSGEPVQVSGITSPQKIKRYLVKVGDEQLVAVEVLESAATLNIRYPNGQLVEDASGVVSWNKPLPTAGVYQIDVIANEETNFTLDISVRN